IVRPGPSPDQWGEGEESVIRPHNTGKDFVMPDILVVDDSLIDLRVAGRLMEQQAGWTVRYARNGREAIERCDDYLPDLIVTDMQMPEMNGLQLVEWVRTEMPLIPVVLMTAAGSEQIAVAAIESGASSYVPKSALADELVITVTRVLAATQQQRGQRRILNALTSVQYTLENDLELLSAAVSEVRQIAVDRWLFTERDTLRFATAVDEALLNAYFHGNLQIEQALRIQDAIRYYGLADERRTAEPYVSRRIRLQLEIGPEEVRVRVGDDGAGFNPAQLPDPRDPGFLERPCGRGVVLMRTFMDEVTFNETGNEVTLMKRRAPRGGDAG
ncbi:MAG: response regulator, partial [Pirellulales bacterium]